MTENNYPKITVVTVCRNAAKEIERTMESVLNQTYPNVEYIVIDGASTDGTVDVIMKYADRLAYWVSEPDNGIYDAMNKGIEHATGEWINFMNAGDEFVDKEVVEKMFCRRWNENVALVYGNERQHIDGNYYSVKPRPFFPSYGYKYGINHQTMFVKNCWAKKYPFDLKYKVAADYDMYNKLYINEDIKFEYLDIDVSLYDLSGFSNNNKYEAYWEYVIISSTGKKSKYLSFIKYFIKQSMKQFIKTVCPSLLRRIKRQERIIEK